MNMKPNTVSSADTDSINELNAALAKIIPPRIQPTISRDSKGNRKAIVPDTASLQKQLLDRARKNQDSQSILQLLPDLELAVQILTSSILSPSDMLTVDLNYGSSSGIFTSDLSAALIDTIRDYIEDECDIKKELPIMMREIIAEKGSYPVAVIPENAIDELINGSRYAISKESVSSFIMDDGVTPRPCGILGPGIGQPQSPSRRRVFTSESLGNQATAFDNRVTLDSNDRVNLVDEYTTVTDNIMVLKFPRLLTTMRRSAVQRAVSSHTKSFSLESAFSSKNTKAISDRVIEYQLFKDRHFQTDQVVTLKTQAELPRKSVGRPLIMKMPSEAVLPVYVPGDHKKHIGYFILLDEEGNPVGYDVKDDFYKNAVTGLNNPARGSVASSLIQRVSLNMGAAAPFDVNDRAHLDYIQQVYADMVERDLLARIKNGINSNSVKIAPNSEIYRLMLARSLQQRYTQLLYVPIDYLTYMAFKYNKSGVGKSLLDDNNVVNTLRTVLMFSNVLGAVKNSIGRTKVTVTLPEEDTDPVGTLEEAQEDIVRSRHLTFPFGGGLNPNDILGFLQRAGFEWNVKGGNLPDMEFNFENTTTSFPKADSELDESLRKHSIMGLGVSPEMVDNGFNSEFATVAAHNNILMTKRIMQYQELFNPALSEHCRKVIRFSESLVRELTAKIKDNLDGIKLELGEIEQEMVSQFGEEEVTRYKVGMALNEFIDKLTVSLPSPPSVTVEHQTELLSNYSEFLDKALEEAYINSNIATNAISGNIDNIKAQIKAYFMRRYMAEKGIGVELGELLATTEDGKPQIELFKEAAAHAEALTRSCIANVAKLTPINNAAQSDLDKLGAPEESSTSDSSSSDSSDNSEDDFGGGAGDLDFDEGESEGSGEESPPAAADDTLEGEEPPATPTM